MKRNVCARIVLWMLRDALAKCFRTWYSNAVAHRSLRQLSFRMRNLSCSKALRTWQYEAHKVRRVRNLFYRTCEAIVEKAFLSWCENVSERKRIRFRPWSCRRRSRSV